MGWWRNAIAGSVGLVVTAVGCSSNGGECPALGIACQPSEVQFAFPCGTFTSFTSTCTGKPSCSGSYCTIGPVKAETCHVSAVTSYGGHVETDVTFTPDTSQCRCSSWIASTKGDSPFVSATCTGDAGTSDAPAE